jgi:agmatinase
MFGLDIPPGRAETVLIPVPWEATTSYRRGTASAPQAIRAASAQVDLFDIELGEPWRGGIAMVDEDPVLVAASAEASAAALTVIEAHYAGAQSPTEAVARVNALSAQLNERLMSEVSGWLDADKLVGVVGGDHSVAYSSIAAHAHRYPGMGVLQIDAHADLRVAYQGFVDSHASVMHRVTSEVPGVAKLVSVGVRDLCAEEQRAMGAAGGRIVPFFDTDLAQRSLGGEPFGLIANGIAAELPEQVYVSFDVDGLDPSLCPHTGTPVPGGLSFHQAMVLLAAVARTRRIVGFDLCEVAPGPAGDDWDANVGARLIYKLIGYALRSRHR